MANSAIPQAEELPKVRSILDPAPPAEDGPDELIQHRFLCREGILLLAAQTGIGKSTLIVQLGIHWAAGRDCFGLNLGKAHQGKGLRILLIQAENDDGDLVEIRDSVLEHGVALSPQEMELVRSQFRFCTFAGSSGVLFVATLDRIIAEKGPFDLIILDPLLAYLGCDFNVQGAVTPFLREHLLPLLRRHSAGLILVHHTNKPARFKEAGKPDARDSAYLGAGSAEFANASRAILVLQGTQDPKIFELRAVKRQARLRWTNRNGTPVTARHISQHATPGVQCWESIDEETADARLQATKGGRPKVVDLIEVLHCVAADPNQSQSTYKTQLHSQTGWSPAAIQRSIADAESRGFLTFKLRGNKKFYSVTEQGGALLQNRPAAYTGSPDRSETQKS